MVDGGVKMNNKNQNDAGKGDAYRRVNKKLYDENYDAIFRKVTTNEEKIDIKNNALCECEKCKDIFDALWDQRLNR